VEAPGAAPEPGEARDGGERRRKSFAMCFSSLVYAGNRIPRLARPTWRRAVLRASRRAPNTRAGYTVWRSAQGLGARRAILAVYWYHARALSMGNKHPRPRASAHRGLPTGARP